MSQYKFVKPGLVSKRGSSYSLKISPLDTSLRHSAQHFMAKLGVLSKGGGGDTHLGDIHPWGGLGVVSTDTTCSMCAGIQQPPGMLEHLGPQSPHRERTTEAWLALSLLEQDCFWG